MSKELKPCPFCQGTDLAVAKKYVECNQCGAQAGWGDDSDEGIEVWNTRTSHPLPTEEEVARVIALHGHATIDGRERRGPPNEKWTQEDWERRVLECIPGEAEQQCRTLARAILSMLRREE